VLADKYGDEHAKALQQAEQRLFSILISPVPIAGHKIVLCCLVTILMW